MAKHALTVAESVVHVLHVQTVFKTVMRQVLTAVVQTADHVLLFALMES